MSSALTSPFMAEDLGEIVRLTAILRVIWHHDSAVRVKYAAIDHSLGDIDAVSVLRKLTTGDHSPMAYR